MKEQTNESTEDLQRLHKLLEEQDRRVKYNKLQNFKLYGWQLELAYASKDYAQMLAMCANQIGKTTCGAAITAFHLTGKYPKNWKGHKFTRPIKAWAAGVSTESTRDILQANMLGEPGNPEDLGAAFIPKEDIVETVRKPQVVGAVQSVTVKHYNDWGRHDGYSKLEFKSYEQGESKFMGRPMDWIWLDEQPDENIYTQCITRTVATKGFVMMTFTPEDGMTPTIHQFVNDRKPGQFLLQASWDDAPHLDEERKEQLLSQYLPHERDMRARGIPFYGTGLVFPIPDEDVIIDPIELPDHWARICGIDFGWDHPTAIVWCAWDREGDEFYIYRTYRRRKATISEHGAVFRGVDQWVPVVYPHDGNKHDGAGDTTADLYRREGVNMAHTHFTNPPPLGLQKGDMKIEPGIMAMLQAMQEGRFKVFASCSDWFQEKSSYHRDEGKIVALTDDLMSASRYAFQSRTRYATTQPFGGSGYDSYSGKDLPLPNKRVF